jgi:hypothetical protein
MTGIVMFIWDGAVASNSTPQRRQCNAFYRPKRDKAALIYEVDCFFRRFKPQGGLITKRGCPVA